MRRDDILLLDMLLAARDAVEFADGLTIETFERNRMAQRAVLKSVEIIGEAASRIGSETRAGSSRDSMGGYRGVAESSGA